jgi:hypothetical protein
MKVSSVELGVVALLIGYVAFYSNSVPQFLASFLASPLGKTVALGGILAVAAYNSLIVGIFLAIAFLMSTGAVTEYLDPKEQKAKEPVQPKSAGVAAPEVNGALKSLLAGTKPSASKGDRMPSVAQKKGTPPVHSTPPVVPPKASAPKTVETFAAF